jgi:hypothetical protein
MVSKRVILQHGDLPGGLREHAIPKRDGEGNHNNCRRLGDLLYNDDNVHPSTVFTVRGLKLLSFSPQSHRETDIHSQRQISRHVGETGTRQRELHHPYCCWR